MGIVCFWSQGLQFSYFCGGDGKMLGQEEGTGNREKGLDGDGRVREGGKVRGKGRTGGGWAKLVNNGGCSFLNIS